MEVHATNANDVHDILLALKSKKVCTNLAKDIRKKYSEPQERRELGTSNEEGGGRVVPRLLDERKCVCRLHDMCVSMV